MRPTDSKSRDDYTREERVVLASIRRSSGRTCRNCAWFEPRGGQKGCFQNGAYKKWLSAEEFSAGCDMFVAKDKKK